MYIKYTDFAGRISMSLLDILVADDTENILEAASKEAEDTIATMAGVLYDIAPEFLKVNAARNGYILSLAKSIALYFLYQKADDENIPEKVIKNYDDAMDDLAKISIGKKALNLPPKPTENTSTGGEEDASITGNGLYRIGSQKRRSNNI